MKIEFVAVLILMFCIGLSSAGFFGDVFGGITGNVVAGGEDFECEDAKVVFDGEYGGYVIPDAVPFGTDVFDVYIDGDFFASFGLEEKEISEMSCSSSEDVSYNVYVSEDLIEEISSGDIGEDVIGFYNEKKKSGELRIEAVGFVKKVKIGFINFGLWVAGWFS